MPFKGPDDPKLPEKVKNHPLVDRVEWVDTWNKSYADCVLEDGSPETCETLAFQVADGVIQNIMPKQSRLVILAATNLSTLVTEKVHTDGRKYLVAPTVAIVEGVMNETLYLESEINAYIEVWNGRPLIIGHPEQGGEFISANSPDFLSKTLGFYFNAKFEDNKLKGEWWLDIGKAQKSTEGMQILVALQSGKMLEQSTGLFADLEEKEGEFDGQKYRWIARNIRPDHVAILPHEEGACSIADGCGTPRVNQSGLSDLTHSSDDNANITVELKSITKTLKSFSKGFKKILSNLSIFNVEDNQMTREELIAWIMENSPIPMTAAMLETANDEELQLIADQILPAAAPAALEDLGAGVEPPPAVNDEDRSFTVPQVPVTTPDAQSPQPPAPNAPPVPEGQDEVTGFLATLPESVSKVLKGLLDLGGLGEVKSLIEQAREAQLSQFDALADVLVANGGYDKEELRKIPLPILAKMITNLGQEMQPMPNQSAPYGGRFFGANTSQTSSEWVPYEGPEGGQ